GRAEESQGAEEPGWTAHASGAVRGGGGGPEAPGEDLATLRARVTEPVDVGQFYESYGRRGIAFRPAFRGVEQLWRGDGEALARIRLPEDVGGHEAYRLHPVLLDACAQTFGAAVPPADATCLQAGVRRVHVLGRPANALWGHARLRTASGSALL